MEEDTRVKVRDTRLTTGDVAAAAERNRRDVEAQGKDMQDEKRFGEEERRFTEDEGAPDKGSLAREAGRGKDKKDGGFAQATHHQSDGEEPSPLLSESETQDFRSRWNNIQTGFVDEPHNAVKSADELVAEIMQRLAQSFSDQRSNLEKQWERSDEVSTEELRLALRRYRSFFDRLLAI